MGRYISSFFLVLWDVAGIDRTQIPPLLPPPPPSMEVQLYLPPYMTLLKAPSREPRRGGGSGKGAPTTPLRVQANFSPPKPKLKVCLCCGAAILLTS